jgi:hypothetical protein
MGVAADGSSGFFQVNSNTNVPISTSITSTSSSITLGQYSSGTAGILPGYFFKGAFWTNNSGSAAVTHAQAVTAIANTRSRLGF